MPKIDRIRAKAERLTERAAALEKRSAEQEAAQNANSADVVARFEAMAADQAARRAEISASIAAVAAEMGELAAMLEEPAPPPPPPKPIPVDLFLEPFSADSAHRTRIGAGVEYGIPPGTLNAKVAKPEYDAGRKGERGRLALVKTFRCGATAQGRKHLIRMSPTDPSRRVVWHRNGGAGTGLPCTLRMPPFARGLYPSGDGDNSLLLYDPAADRVYQLNQFEWGDGECKARAVTSYSLAGRDVRHRFDDPGEWGPGAIDWRHPAGFLRGREVDLTGAVKIRHTLNITATRHSGAGARADQHILSKRMAFPAWETDRPMPADYNLGDLPYGTILAIRWQDRGLRETLGLSPFGKILFDTFLEHGGCLCDGQGQIVDSAPVLQLRVDAELALDAAKVKAVDETLAKLLPHLWPVFNPRRHDGEDQFGPDGVAYVGGGGPPA
jgi:hypothetical protein